MAGAGLRQRTDAAVARPGVQLAKAAIAASFGAEAVAATMHCIIYADLDAYYAAVEQLDEPGLQ